MLNVQNAASLTVSAITAADTSETAEPVSSELLLFPQPASTTVISKAAMVTAMVVLAKAALNFLYRKDETYVSPCYQKIEIFYHRIYRIFRSKEPHFSVKAHEAAVAVIPVKIEGHFREVF